MCRWIAYRGETIPLEQYVTAPAHSLVVQSLKALESTASTNGDGFGMGWYGEHPEPGLYREVRPAWSDENLRYLCRHIRSNLFFAHVRAATGTPITRPNCHPFACGRWMFMHNGSVGNWARLRRQVESLIPDELYGSRDRHYRFRGRLPRHPRRWRRQGSGRRDLRNPRQADGHGERRPTQGAVAVHGRAHQWPRPLCLPLRRQRQGQLALLSRVRRQYRRGFRATRRRTRATGSRCHPAL